MLLFFPYSPDCYKVSLTLYNNVSAEIWLKKSGKFVDLVREVNLFCHCRICYVDKQEAQLFAVNQSGKGTKKYFYSSI